MKITLIGHSTVLIETQGKRLLTDPFFNLHGNPAYRRVAPPAMSREELAEVDLVLLSHSHFDHIDRPFLRALPSQTPVITNVRAGTNRIPAKLWQPVIFGPITITPVPAVHLAPTTGFVIQNEDVSVYFAADTYFRSFMTELRQRFRLDAALMPVTTYRIPMTMGESQAVRAVQALQPDVVIPIHLGIQPRSPLMRTNQTPEGFARRLQQAGSPTQVVILREGMSWSTPSLAATQKPGS
jgi:L-ascorbate metabolism protein UlaG (beta-lactamase superfamily)